MIIPISLHAKQVSPPQERNTYWQRAFGPNFYTLTVDCKEMKSYEIEGVEGPSRISLIVVHVFSFIRDFFSILYKNAKTKSATALIIAADSDNKENQKKITIYTKSLINRAWQSKSTIPVARQYPSAFKQSDNIQKEEDIKQALVGFILETSHLDEMKLQEQIQKTRNDHKRGSDSPEEKESRNPHRRDDKIDFKAID